MQNLSVELEIIWPIQATLSIHNDDMTVTKSIQQPDACASLGLEPEEKSAKKDCPQVNLHQANNVTNANKSSESLACAKPSQPVEGRVNSFDHVTFWVGNAKQSAVFYMTQFGFEPFAFRGLETGSRDVACHVVRLNETIIQFVSAVEPMNTKLNEFLLSHGDAIKDVAFRVDNIEDLVQHAIEQGAELVAPLEVETFDAKPDNASASGQPVDKYVVKRATIKTFGDVTHTFVERNYEYDKDKFLPGYHKPSLEVSTAINDDLYM